VKASTGIFHISDIANFKQQLLNWANRFGSCCFLDSHGYDLPHQKAQCLVAVGSVAAIELAADGQALERLQEFVDAHQGQWLFGHLGYDLKNEIEQLSSTHKDEIGFADACLFVPEVVLQWQDHELHISSQGQSASAIFDAIARESLIEPTSNDFSFAARISREDYIQKINHLKNHLQRGDCFEINFCQEFYCADATVDAAALFVSLCQVSPNPFACFYKNNDRYLFCASPERYITKKGPHILSQPIKGTAKRVVLDELLDAQTKNALQSSAKDKSENVMVVDLVRNDLSKVCEEGSVQVDELFGVYSFPQVHQMISTVSGTLLPDANFSSIIRASFPMGSMTGAPKKRVMELIEQYETSRRGIFSGAVGYIDPAGDFDWNVVIRSLMYNAQTRYLSYQVGSGITIYSEAEQEYDECLMKAEAMRKV
jgi:para-aminobenzoate synthetase component I